MVRNQKFLNDFMMVMSRYHIVFYNPEMVDFYLKKKKKNNQKRNDIR